MEVIPFEMCYAIQDFFDDQTIIKMGQVNVDWYHITKNRRTTILQQLDSFQYMDVYQQTMHIIECLYNNNIQKIKMFLELGVIHPKSTKFSNLSQKLKHIINSINTGVLSPIYIFRTAYYIDNLFDIALVCGNLNMIKLFIKHGFDVNKRNCYSRKNPNDEKIGCTPLCVFIKNYNYLLNEELFCDNGTWPSFGISDDYMNVLIYLCENGADPTKDSIILPYYQIIHPINVIDSNNTGKYVSSMIKDVLREYGSFEPNSYSSDEEYFYEEEEEEEWGDYYN